MKVIFRLLILVIAATKLSAQLAPEQVAVLYNSHSAESKELAQYYANARGIPQANLVALPLPEKDIISRDEYNKTLLQPLKKIFTQRQWWTMGQSQDGIIQPISAKINALVCMRGVPYKIAQTRLTPKQRQARQQAKAAGTFTPEPKGQTSAAAVDSELSLLGAEGLPIKGPIANPYFNKEHAFNEANLPSMLLVGRIDAPSNTLCKSMIDDALTIEAKGLWGMCYLDLSLKKGNFQAADQWLEDIAELNYQTGIPTVTDRNKQTLTTNYPMEDCAIYFGWYTQHRNGPLLNPSFRFRKGAIASHLHSYSALQLRDVEQNWCAAIIARGAAATLGNVYEPYLGLVHRYDIFYKRLLEGHTLIEAAYMASPALSWQNITIGDPLYRPFIHIDGSGEKDFHDLDYRAIRLANSIWKNEPKKVISKLKIAAEAKDKSSIFEYLGLRYRHEKQNTQAINYFKKALHSHAIESDRLRQWLHIADTQRHSVGKETAIKTLRKAKESIPEIAETLSLKALLNILDPPQPPPVGNN